MDVTVYNFCTDILQDMGSILNLKYMWKFKKQNITTKHGLLNFTDMLVLICQSCLDYPYHFRNVVHVRDVAH